MSEEWLKTILGKLEKMDEKIQKMDEKIDRIEQKLDATFEQTAKSAESINEIAAAQDRHERVLEVLSRSIEQQAFRSNKAP